MTKLTDHPAQSVAGLPFDKLWAIDDGAFANIISTLRATDVSAMRADRSSRRSRELDIVNGVAVIPISGPLSKSLSLFSIIFGSSTYQQITQQVEVALHSDEVDSILLAIDSPGGTTSGLAETGDAIFDARKSKPVVAQVTGMCASAAYYLASQAERISAQRMDMVGSIGVRMMMMDISEMLSNKGIRPVLIDTGEFKSTGVPGTKISERQQEYIQGLVDAMFDEFKSVITRGRNLSGKRLEAVCDGRVWHAADAMKLGLIDSVQSFDKTLSALGGSESSGASAEIQEDEESESEETKETFFGMAKRLQAEGQSVEESLRAAERAFPDSSNKNKTPNSRVVTMTPKRTPVTTATTATSNWKAAVQAERDCGLSSREAIAAANRKHPGLREKMLAEVNAK